MTPACSARGAGRKAQPTNLGGSLHSSPLGRVYAFALGRCEKRAYHAPSRG
jgi:hypothetical protein